MISLRGLAKMSCVPMRALCFDAQPIAITNWSNAMPNNDRCKNCGQRYPKEVREALVVRQVIDTERGIQPPPKTEYQTAGYQRFTKEWASPGAIYELIPKGLALPKRWGMAMKIRRDQLKLSQSALAERLSVSQPTIAYWEKGEKPPGLDTLAAIANALEIAPSELFRFEE